jgi:hypothetical protein
MRTNEFLKQFPPEDHPWDGKVTFSFGYPTEGWIQVAVTCTAYVQGVIVNFSNVYDPFPEFIQWLNDIAEGNLPSEFIVDEEGHGKIFRATPVNDQVFTLQILEWAWNKEKAKEQPIYLYVQVTKEQFLSEFLKRWDDFLTTQYDPIHWEEYGVDLRKLDVSKIRVFSG